MFRKQRALCLMLRRVWVAWCQSTLHLHGMDPMGPSFLLLILPTVFLSPWFVPLMMGPYYLFYIVPELTSLGLGFSKLWAPQLTAAHSNLSFRLNPVSRVLGEHCCLFMPTLGCWEILQKSGCILWYRIKTSEQHTEKKKSSRGDIGSTVIGPEN